MRSQADLISMIRYDCERAISKRKKKLRPTVTPCDEHGQCTAGARVIYNVYGAHNEYLARPPERFLTPLTVSKWVLGSGRVPVTLFFTNGNVMTLLTSSAPRSSPERRVLFTAIINARDERRTFRVS